MMSNDFEEAFSNFLERREYDEAESALFSMVGMALLAALILFYYQEEELEMLWPFRRKKNA